MQSIGKKKDHLNDNPTITSSIKGNVKGVTNENSFSNPARSYYTISTTTLPPGGSGRINVGGIRLRFLQHVNHLVCLFNKITNILPRAVFEPTWLPFRGWCPNH